MSALTDFADDETRLDWLIAEIEKTPVDSWQTEVVRRVAEDGSETNCFFGHLYNIAGGDDLAPNGRTKDAELWDWFEDRWATTYMVYPVNDGEFPMYSQAHARDRIVAFLRDLRNGKVPSTRVLMERQWADFQAAELIG